MNNKAFFAIYAVKHIHQWGLWAAWKFARSRGVSPGVFVIALESEELSKYQIPNYLNQAY